MTIATVILESDDPSPVLIQGLTVRVFDTGGMFVTSGATDVNGEAIFDIPDADYDIYFFKQGVSILAGMPQRITVDAGDPDVPPNTFLVVAHIATLPESVDPLRCRISGDLMLISGGPSAGVDGSISFELKEGVETGVLSGKIIAPQGTFHVKAADDGTLEFELLRNVEYRALFPMLREFLQCQPPELQVIVPDLPALALSDLLFPVLVDASFSATVLALTAGADPDESIEVTLTYSDGSDNSIRSLPPRFQQVSSSSDDEDVALVELAADKFVVTPLSAGVANITVTRLISTSFPYDPAPTFVTETLVVTVT